MTGIKEYGKSTELSYKKKRGLNPLNSGCRTLIAFVKRVYISRILNRFQAISDYKHVIASVTPFQYIGFCHTKSENFSINKVLPMLLYPPQNFMITKVITHDKNRVGMV